MQKYDVISFCEVFSGLIWLSSTSTTMEYHLETTLDLPTFTRLRNVDNTCIGKSNILTSKERPLVEHLRWVFNWLGVRFEGSKNMLEAHQIGVVRVMTSIRFALVKILNICGSKLFINICSVVDSASSISSTFSTSQKNLVVFQVLPIIDTPIVFFFTYWHLFSGFRQDSSVNPLRFSFAVVVNDCFIFRASNTMRN